MCRHGARGQNVLNRGFTSMEGSSTIRFDYEHRFAEHEHEQFRIFPQSCTLIDTHAYPHGRGIRSENLGNGTVPRPTRDSFTTGVTG
mgnify:CR=1 FL=1